MQRTLEIVDSSTCFENVNYLWIQFPQGSVEKRDCEWRIGRLFEELRSRYTSERLSLLADTEALQAERRRLVVQLTDAATQRAASETKLRAANKSIT